MSDMVDKLDGLYAKAVKRGGLPYCTEIVQAWPGIARALRAAERVRHRIPHTHRSADQDPETPRFAIVGKCRACDFNRALDALKEAK